MASGCGRALWLTAAVVLGLGCSDTSAPSGEGETTGVDLAVASVAAPTYGEQADGIALIACETSLLATLDGRGTVSWLGAQFRFFPSHDLTIPFDSTTLGPEDATASWGGAGLSRAHPQVSSWSFYATIPFTVEVVYTFRRADNSVGQTAAAAIPCLPPLAADSTPPRITAISLEPATGVVEPGDTLSVAFTVEAPGGLWQTLAAVSGACDTFQYFAGRLAANATHRLDFVLPPSCLLGVPLEVSIYALDAALQSVEHSPAPTLTVADQTAPTLRAYFGPGGSAPTASGIYFVGDTLTFVLAGQDNHRVRTVSWSVQPPGGWDSLDVLNRGGTGSAVLEIDPSWGPRPGFHFAATDLAGNISDTASIDSDSLRLYPDHPRPAAWHQVPGDTRDILADPGRGVAYVLLGNQGQVVTVGLDDAVPRGTLTLPSNAAGFDLLPSRDSLVVSLPLRRSLLFVDLTGAAPQMHEVRLATVDSAAGEYPTAVVSTGNGMVFASIGAPPFIPERLLEFRISDGRERVRTDAGASGQIGSGPTRSHGHSYFVVGDPSLGVQVFDVASDRFGSPVHLGPPSGEFQLSLDGTVRAYGRRILDAGNQVLREVESMLGGASGATALTPDGQFLFYSTGRALVRTRVSDGGIIDRTRVPIAAEHVRISEDGQWAVFHGLPGFASGQVGILDLR